MPWTSYRGKIAALTRSISAGERPADDPALGEAYRDMRAAQVLERVHKAMDAQPSLTAEHRRYIAGVLLAGLDTDAAGGAQ